jgi:SAM-dependent methyltransferase
MADWDKRYREGEHLMDEPHPLVVESASSVEPGQALDLACGAGRHALWLAEHGWTVTAVDSSRVAIEFLQKQCHDRGVAVHPVVADLEKHEFAIAPESYDLIVLCNYLQRDFFPSIRTGTRVGGLVVAIIAMVDSDPRVRPMNPGYLLNPGDLRAEFAGWRLLHDVEGKPAGNPSRRATAEVAAQRL